MITLNCLITLEYYSWMTLDYKNGLIEINRDMDSI